jgi:hypothetical protein
MLQHQMTEERIDLFVAESELSFLTMDLVVALLAELSMDSVVQLWMDLEQWYFPLQVAEFPVVSLTKPTANYYLQP